MSLAAAPMEKRVTYDPTANLDHKPVYMIEKSGSSTAYQRVITTNFSNSQLTWQVPVPNTSTILDRYMLMQVKFQATVVGPTPASGNLIQDNQGFFALRSWPLNKCITSASVLVDTQTITATPYRYASAFERSRMYEHFTNVGGSSFPSLPDQSQEYSDVANMPVNPLGDFQNSTYYQQARGTFPWRTVSYQPNVPAVGQVTQKIEFTIAEPLLLSPLLYAPDDLANGFVYLNQFQITCQLGNLQRLFSKMTGAGANTFTSLDVSVLSNPTLLCRFVSPDPTMPMPKEIVYPYSNIQAFTTSVGATAGGTSNTLTTNNIQLSQVPEKIYLYVRQDDAELQKPGGYTQTDSFAGINKVSVLFNNVSGILSSAAPEDLWRLSVRNGVQLKWSDWIGGGPVGAAAAGAPTADRPQIAVGSILCMRPTVDFGLPADLAPGVIGGQYNLAIDVTFTNLAPTSKNLSIYVIVVQDGMITITSGMEAQQQLGTLTKEDVLNSRQYQQYGYHESRNPWGGSFWSEIKKVAQEAMPIVEKGAEMALKYGPMVAPLLAAGVKKSGAGVMGGGVMGGKKITARDMRKRLL